MHGATIKRDLTYSRIRFNGVVQAMDFLPHNNKVVDGQIKRMKNYMQKIKMLIVIGGGDTGSDCIGTSNRQWSKTVTNFEIMPKATLKIEL